jgi:hypothetical protein
LVATATLYAGATITTKIIKTQWRLMSYLCGHNE